MQSNWLAFRFVITITHGKSQGQTYSQVDEHLGWLMGRKIDIYIRM